VKRRALPDLSRILDESRPIPSVPILEKRIHTRFDKAFLVVIGSELYGDSFAIARNVSTGGILVEMSYAPPLGTVVTVHFQLPRQDEPPTHRDRRRATPRDELLDVLPATPVEIVARAEVKHHHYLNFTGGDEAASSRAIGLRFLEFVDNGEPIDPAKIH